MRLTWKQLKEIVEAELAAKGIDENVTICYFDFSWPTGPDSVAAYAETKTDPDTGEKYSELTVS